jgi:predicted lipoprotein with Yx(FWY)xxD motif
MPTKLTAPSAGLSISLALVLAACGSSKKQAAAPPAPVKAPATTSTPAAPPAKGTTVDVRSGKLGRYVVDSSGRSLYLFEKDKGGKSACSGACAKVWSPLSTKAAPSAGTGVTAAKLSTLTRTDGTMQVVYNGHPLYHYDDDHKAGQIEGEGSKQFGAEWYIVSPKGAKLEEKGS